MTHRNLYLDMDGVLADFDTGYERLTGTRPDRGTRDVDWQLVRDAPDFYANLPPMPDLQELIGYVIPHHPVVLTGVPADVDEAARNKREWVRRHLGDEMRVICCRSAEKYLFATPGSVLVDDWEKYRDLWVNAGGIWITHTSARSTIEQLKKVL